MMVQGLGYLPPMGETWLELLALAWPSSGWLLGCLENSQWMEVPLAIYLSVYLSISLPFRSLKKKSGPTTPSLDSHILGIPLPSLVSPGSGALGTRPGLLGSHGPLGCRVW